MPRSWSRQAVAATQEALEPLRDPRRAGPMTDYMKGVAPFLGIPTPDRRHALRRAWTSLPAPSSRELGEAATALMALQEREFHYAAYDLVARYLGRCDEYFLDSYVTHLLQTKPWWDTFDGFVTAAVSPLCRSYDADWLVDEWSESGDRWLVRAAIGHQRGWKSVTDVERVLGLCDRHWADREFFVAKAIGWAMRDIARINPVAVRRFLAARTTVNPVATREAERGLAGRR